MPVERVAGSAWNRWPDVHGIGGRITVVRAVQPQTFQSIVEQSPPYGDARNAIDHAVVQREDPLLRLRQLRMRSDLQRHLLGPGQVVPGCGHLRLSFADREDGRLSEAGSIVDAAYD